MNHLVTFQIFTVSNNVGKTLNAIIRKISLMNAGRTCYYLESFENFCSLLSVSKFKTEVRIRLVFVVDLLVLDYITEKPGTLESLSFMNLDPFRLIQEDTSKLPHRFKACRFDRNHQDCWSTICENFLVARRLTANAFFNACSDITTTGFQKIGLDRYLNQSALDQLPSTPNEDSNVTKDPAVTDMTEILALEALKWEIPDIELPYPRVLHKEMFTLQHHGIDSLGYTENDGEFKLYIIEVMASCDINHPPQTVKDHLKQILTKTLNETSSTRLLKDLQTVHDESREDRHKDVVNGFIVAILAGNLQQSQAVIASPVFVRRFNEFDENDWKPFLKRCINFETAKIPSTILFLAMECNETFCGLLDQIKDWVSGQNEHSPIKGGDNDGDNSTT